MPVTINAHQLGRLIDRTIGHIGSEFTEPLHGIRLEADTTFLYAAASDRYTIAAARYHHQGLDDGEPIAHTLPAASLPALRQWISTQPGSDPITVTASEDRMRFAAPHSDLGIDINAGSKFFDWRGILRRVIEQTSDSGTFPVLDTRLLGRFGAADDMVRVRVTADRQAVLIVGEDFLGAQMPARARRDGIGTEDLATPDQVRASWQHTLAAGDAATMTDGIPAAADHTRYEVSKDIAETAGELLKQTLRSTHHMFASDISSEALAAYATAGVTAWTAYRYLDALHTADPKLAAAVVAETAAQLEDGAIGEFAWDAAEKAGHDPKKWQDEFEARAAKKQAAAQQTGDKSPASAA